MWFSAFDIIILLYTVTTGLCDSSRSVQLSRCANANSDEIFVSYWSTLEACYDQCYSRKECKSIMYQIRMGRCSLKRTEHLPTDTTTTNNRLCAYRVVSELKLGEINSCNNHDCMVGEMCVPTGTIHSMYECVKSECPDAPVVPNAIVLSTKRNILSTTAYKCKRGYWLVGRTQIHCQSNGTWTTPNFVCTRACHVPQGHLFNADLTKVELKHNGYYTGTTLQYTCREEYSGSGLAATSSCNKHGKWNPRRVPCCAFPMTPIEGRCIQVHNSTSLQSRSDAINVCSSTGGARLSNKIRSVTTYAATNEQCTWLLLNKTKETFENENNITECFELYDSLSIQPSTYDEAVQIIRENGFLNGTCSSAYEWTDGEPNGNSTENCMYLNLRSLYIHKYYDESCDFDNLNNTCFVCAINLPFI